MSESCSASWQPRPPSIPEESESPKSNRKSFRKTMQGLIPVVPHYPDGLIPVKTPTSPSFVEKEVGEHRYEPGKDNFVPLDLPGKGENGPPGGAKRRRMIALWALGILLILGLSLGLGLGLGLKGLQQSTTATSQATITLTPTSMAKPAGAVATGTPTTASASTSATPNSTSHAGQVVKAKSFPQAAFAPPDSATTTTYTVAAATATSGVGFIDCPASDGTTYTSNGKTFTRHCYTDYPGPGVLNLGVVTVTSLEQCIDACVRYSGERGSCGAVSYRADLSVMVPAMHGNCALKDKSGVAQPGMWDQESAVLS